MYIDIKKFIIKSIIAFIIIYSMLWLYNNSISTNSKITQAKSSFSSLTTGSNNILDVTYSDEKSLEFEGLKENLEIQGDLKPLLSSGNISYGEKVGLTYFSQIDPRWKNTMYSSIGNTNQTIGSSGCGPTSAAMIVTSIKGVFTPNEMAELYVKNRI